MRAHAQAGDLHAAAAAAERLVRAEPFSEPAHQLRIRVLGEGGDQAGAVAAYEHCRAVLASELGVRPSAATESVYREALASVPVAGARETAAGGLAAYSVLVVEDHDFQRRTAVQLLRGLGVGTIAEAARRPGGAGRDRALGAARRDRVRPRDARDGRRGVHPPHRRARARERGDHLQRDGAQGGALRRGARRGLRPAAARRDREAVDRTAARRAAGGAPARPGAPHGRRGARRGDDGRRHRRAARWADRRPLPAGGRPRDRQRQRRRGNAGLARPGQGLDRAGGVHGGARGRRAGQRLHRARLRPGVRRRAGVRARRTRHRRQGHAAGSQPRRPGPGRPVRRDRRRARRRRATDRVRDRPAVRSSATRRASRRWCDCG